MVTKKIESLQHPSVLHWVKLRQDRAYREEKKALLITGKKMIEELPIARLITTSKNFSFSCPEVYEVSDAILKKITGLEHPDGFAAEIDLPPPQAVDSKKSLLILDQIQDPGNLGTLLRTALALSWEGVICTPGTVDLFNDKALRAGKGAQFHLPYCWMSREKMGGLKHQIFVADLKGKNLEEMIFTPPYALILSHEGQGVDPWFEKRAEKISIPMNPKVESLNVAASGAIFLYEMRLS